MALPSRPDILEVIPVGDREWCVCDRRRRGPARPLAYISRLHDSRFMVTGLDGERGWVLFREYPAALDAVRARCLRSSESPWQPAA